MIPIVCSLIVAIVFIEPFLTSSLNIRRIDPKGFYEEYGQAAVKALIICKLNT
jgi:hypothetical protein